MLVCALYLFYYAMQQALELTAHQRSFKMIKTRPKKKLHERLRRVFTIFGKRRSKTVTMCFGVVIFCVIMSALGKVHKQVVYCLLRGGGEIPGYFCLISEFKLNLITQTLRPLQRQFVSVLDIWLRVHLHKINPLPTPCMSMRSMTFVK